MFTSQTATRAPSAASRRHVAAPMPLAPPVTIAVCPSSLTAREPILRPTMSLPPGPRAPAAVQMWEWIARPIPFLERCSRRYGDLFTVRFPIGTVAFTADPGLIKDVFTGDPDVFHAGEANATPLEPLMGRNSVLLLDGREHMRQRRLMLPSFHGERMQRYGD